jgi:hypothetical protein
VKLSQPPQVHVFVFVLILSIYLPTLQKKEGKKEERKKKRKRGGGAPFTSIMYIKGV